MSQSHKGPSNAYIYSFVTTLCLVCALVLSLLASLLKVPQQEAAVLDQSKQMLMAAKILDHRGFFLLETDEGYTSAEFKQGAILEASDEEVAAETDQILDVYKRRIHPMVVDSKGQVQTFKDAGINYDQYLDDNSKDGFAQLPKKLIYRISGNASGADSDTDGYIVPVNGMGLWDRIYGYIAVKPDGKTVIGIAWYKHAETPGLGANIAEPKWQAQFPGKKIFQPDPEGNVDMAQAPIGIEVRRGKVVDELGETPRAISAVDGMAGATLTGVGVTKAYKDSLDPYRAFFIKANQERMN